mmetsp:Transcript_18093/g.52714  ORF Transcript_18093/g.52714 Transcript_18093/m.52714 type:complete len:348 (-) Transcript_18093:437-1480(-)
MIGFVMRGLLGIGMPFEGCCACVVGSFTAMCVLLGVRSCMQMRMRDCSCIKRWMRATGADKFDDFELMVLVHEAMYTSTHKKLTTLVRVSAGMQVVETDESNKGLFQQPLSILVEQGTDVICLELIEKKGKKVLAALKLDIEKELLDQKDGMRQKVVSMKQKSKGVTNPRLKVTFALNTENEAEKGLLAGIDLGVQANMMLREQLQMAEDGIEGEPMSELDLLAKGCTGPVDMFGKWGSRDTVYISVKGPPEVKRYCLGVWKDRGDIGQSLKALHIIDLLKIVSVQPDPGRNEVFVITFMTAEKTKKRLTFRRLDRSRETWVDMFQLLIKRIHDKKESERRHRPLPI